MCGTAAMQMKLREHARHNRHRRAELQRHAGDILRVQRLALMRNVRPGCRATLAFKERLQMIEVMFAKNPHADARAGRGLAGASQHETVMTRFLDAAQIEGVTILQGDDKADHFGVEQSGSVEIFHSENGMAAARDVERRVVIGAGKVHHAGPFNSYCPSSVRASSLPWRSSPIASTSSRPSRVPSADISCRKFFGPEVSASRTLLNRAAPPSRGGRGRRPLSRASVLAGAVTSNPILESWPWSS